jgi:hypothetical protein
MGEAIWISATARLPADGQTVLVKTAHGTVEHRVTFRAAPQARWESRHVISELELYKYWRPAPLERRRPASHALAAAP